MKAPGTLILQFFLWYTGLILMFAGSVIPLHVCSSTWCRWAWGKQPHPLLIQKKNIRVTLLNLTYTEPWAWAPGNTSCDEQVSPPHQDPLRDSLKDFHASVVHTSSILIYLFCKKGPWSWSKCSYDVNMPLDLLRAPKLMPECTTRSASLQACKWMNNIHVSSTF